MRHSKDQFLARVKGNLAGGCVFFFVRFRFAFVGFALKRPLWSKPAIFALVSVDAGDRGLRFATGISSEDVALRDPVMPGRRWRQRWIRPGQGRPTEKEGPIPHSFQPVPRVRGVGSPRLERLLEQFHGTPEFDLAFFATPSRQ